MPPKTRAAVSISLYYLSGDRFSYLYDIIMISVCQHLFTENEIQESIPGRTRNPPHDTAAGCLNLSSGRPEFRFSVLRDLHTVL